MNWRIETVKQTWTPHRYYEPQLFILTAVHTTLVPPSIYINALHVFLTVAYSILHYSVPTIVHIPPLTHSFRHPPLPTNLLPYRIYITFLPRPPLIPLRNIRPTDRPTDMAQNSPDVPPASGSSPKTPPNLRKMSSKPIPKHSSKPSVKSSPRASQFDQHARRDLTPRALLSRVYFLTVMTLLFAVAITVCILFVLPTRLLRRMYPGRQPRPKQRLNEKIPLTVHEPREREEQPRDTLLLIHGFPDSPSLWTDTVSRLNRAGYRCLVVALPACWGQAAPAVQFATIVERLRAAVAAAGASVVTVVAHDWGAVFAQRLHRAVPTLFHRVVLVDVVDTEELARMPFPDAVCFWAYVSLFALAYRIAHPFGSFLIQSTLALARYDVRPVSELRSDMAWPYATLIADAFAACCSELRERLRSPLAARRAAVQRGTSVDVPLVPTLYVYGKRKVFMYHSDEWIKHVLRTPCGHVEKVDSDHWVMIRKKAEWISLLLKWLERSNDCVRRG